MILKNPTNKTVSIVYQGSQYSVKPNDTIEVSDVVGEHWIKIHEFLTKQEVVESPKKTTKKEEDK